MKKLKKQSEKNTFSYKILQEEYGVYKFNIYDLIYINFESASNNKVESTSNKQLEVEEKIHSFLLV